MSNGLPEGFVLDEPEQLDASPVALPQGFTLDEPTTGAQQATPVEGQGDQDFLSRLDEAWTRREEAVDEMVARNLEGGVVRDVMSVPKMGALAAGQVAGGVVDVFAEGVESAYKTLVPDAAQDAIMDKFRKLGQTDIGRLGIEAITKGGEAYKSFKEFAPDAALALEGAFNIAIATPRPPTTPKAIPAAVKAVKKVTPKAIKEAPERLYQSAAKFSTTIPAKERQAMARLALEEGISPTLKGWEKIQTKIVTLNNEITKAIDTATGAGKKIKGSKLVKHFDDLREEATLSGAPKKNKALIDNIENQLKEAGKRSYTPKEAQKLKQNIYKEVNTAFGKLSTPYQTKAKKALARAAKEELEVIYPQLAKLNAKEGAFINLQKSIEQAANRITNRDLLGIGVPIKGTLGASAGGPGGAAAGVLTGIIDAPRVKAAIAQALNKIGKIEGKIPLPGVRAGVVAGKAAANNNLNSNENKNALYR